MSFRWILCAWNFASLYLLDFVYWSLPNTAVQLLPNNGSQVLLDTAMQKQSSNSSIKNNNVMWKPTLCLFKYTGWMLVIGRTKEPFPLAVGAASHSPPVVSYGKSFLSYQPLVVLQLVKRRWFLSYWSNSLIAIDRYGGN